MLLLVIFTFGSLFLPRFSFLHSLFFPSDEDHRATNMQGAFLWSKCFLILEIIPKVWCEDTRNIAMAWKMKGCYESYGDK